jgi:acyl-coenzyme A synthetase/AMP-(fatty) acid ligase
MSIIKKRCTKLRDFSEALKSILDAESDRDYLKSDIVTLSYKSCHLAASRLSDAIITLLDKKNAIIGLHFSSKINQILASWACIFSKNAFFPLNANTSLVRLRGSLQFCDLVITDDEIKVEQLIIEGFRIIKKEKFYEDKIVFILENLTKVEKLRNENICYLMQTSGSTGSPKVVAQSFESCFVFSSWASEASGINSKDIVLSISPLYFDMSIFDIFSTAIKKCVLYVPDQSIFIFPKTTIEVLINQCITSIYLTPTLMKRLTSSQILKNKKNFIKKIILAGENFSPILLNEIRDCFDSPVILNFYGPTETNVCTYSDLSDQEYVTIGKPCPYSEIKLYDNESKQFNLLSGEILVSGPTLAISYLDQDMNKDFININNINYYKTGDFAKNTLDGFVFEGRKDHQIKINGYRFSLTEVENEAVKIYPGNDYFALLHEDFIYLLVVKKEILLLDKLKEALVNRLPSYMVPKNIFIIDKENYNNYVDTYKIDSKNILLKLKEKLLA